MNIREEATKLRKKVEDEKTNPIKIALFGQPGAGKSSIINKIVGKDIAESGVTTDKTTEAQIIEWSNDMILVDLPGYGTSMFPQNDFFDKFNITDYDLFLCVFSGKFHKADTDFFQEIREKGKVALLVRNQVDVLWQEGKNDNELRDEIRKDAQKQVKLNEEVYFTSCRTNNGFDELEQAIQTNLEPSKKERWSRTAKAYTQEALDVKKDACKSLIRTRAGLAAANALNPIPGVGIAIDISILVELFLEIRKNYGLTDEKINNPEYIKTLGPLVNKIMSYSTKEGAMQLLKKFASQETIKEVSKYIPFVGQAIAASIGYGITLYAGNSFVDDCHELAKKILDQELGYE
jgi:small GTP-binding protein